MAECSLSGNSVPSIGDSPHQPQSFAFPNREFGQKFVVSRSFQANWFKSWKWLHYDEESDNCHTCVKAYKEKKLFSNTSDPSFIKRGFHNWKDATLKFRAHESSNTHKEAILKIVTLPKTTKDVGESLSSAVKLEKLERRAVMMKILSNIRFLARQGLAFRGDGDETDSNFMQLFLLQSEDNPKLLGWLQKRTDKYTSPEIQNSIIKVMGLQVLRKIASELHSAPFYSIMVDETTDVSNREQVVVCLRSVTNNFVVHESFVGLYLVDAIDTGTLFDVIKDVLARLNISFNKIRGQCYDGASSMSGAKSGVAKKLLDNEPRAVFTHCYGHALNLACNDSIKQCKLMKDVLDTTYEICKLVKSHHAEIVYLKS